MRHWSRERRVGTGALVLCTVLIALPAWPAPSGGADRSNSSDADSTAGVPAPVPVLREPSPPLTPARAAQADAALQILTSGAPAAGGAAGVWYSSAQGSELLWVGPGGGDCTTHVPVGAGSPLEFCVPPAEMLPRPGSVLVLDLYLPGTPESPRATALFHADGERVGALSCVTGDGSAVVVPVTEVLSVPVGDVQRTFYTAATADSLQGVLRAAVTDRQGGPATDYLDSSWTTTSAVPVTCTA
uniref:Uncharacterized protein n=1 Tax=Kitasatospora viridis TaxID=281105 RepID=A0A561TTU3_9ACTN|nr:hypothetical protein [Kitasatospora viridis]TWF90535.1 hypothetical protein FHX73_13582 [Kitasatospora viridis]